jgi:hypothetical protein
MSGGPRLSPVRRRRIVVVQEVPSGFLAGA